MNITSGLLPRFFLSKEKRYRKTIQGLLTPLDQALTEVTRRRKDKSLIAHVRDYLGNDIPAYFDRTKPVCYLSRHIATPNEETLMFIDRCTELDDELPIIIGQDLEDLFSSNNILKRNLVKLPLTKGLDKNNNPIVEKVSVANFNTIHKQKLRDIKTITDKPLQEFHTNLLQQASSERVELVDESDWVSRNHRGDLVAHYEKLLALLIVHGIMFEFYEPEDEEFVYNVLIPAYRSVETEFGCTPLITPLIVPGREQERDWNGYPPMMYQHVMQQLNHELPLKPVHISS